MPSFSFRLNRISLLAVPFALTLLAGCEGYTDPANPAPPAAPAATPVPTATPTPKKMSIYDFKIKKLDGSDFDFSTYRDRVMLIVNTASKCGYTPQYGGLQKLHEKYASRGLRVMGFPANDFGNQEPGSDTEIGEFCQKNYGVSFDMFSKVPVKGPDKAPLFRYLTTEANPEQTGEIGWNFEKFLVSRDGKLIKRFKSNVAPDNAEFIAAVEAELAKK